MTRWRRWLRRVLWLLVAAIAVVAIAWVLGRGALADWLARRGEAALAAALGQPVGLAETRFQLLPPVLSIATVTVGEGGEALRVGDLSARLALVESLRKARPQIELAAADVFVDVPKLSASQGGGAAAEPAAAPPRLPPLAVALSLGGIDVRLGGGRALRSGAVAADAQVSRGQGLGINVRAGDIVASEGERRVAWERLEVAAGRRGGTWLIERAALRGSALSVDVAGDETPLRHRVDVKGDLAALTQFLPEQWRAEGGLSAQLELIGDLADPHGDATLRVDNAAWAGIRPGRVEAAAKRAGGRVAVPELRVELGGGSLSLRGELRESKNLPVQAVLTAQNLDLEVFEPLLGDLDRAAVQLNGSVEVAGEALVLRGTARGQGTLLPRQGREIAWMVDVGANGATKTLRATAQQAQGTQMVADVAVRDDALSGSLRADVPDVGPLGELLAGLAPAAVLPRAGRVAVDAQLSGTLSRPELQAVVDGRALVLNGGAIDSLEAVLRGDARALEVQRAVVRVPDGGIEASGVFALVDDVDNDWRAQSTGVDAGWVLDLLADVDVLPPIPVRGRAVASVRAAGPWNGVNIAGEAAMAAGELAGEPLRDVRADFEVRDETWRVDAQAAGDGAAHLEAHLAGEGGRLQLAATGSGWQLDKLASLDGNGLAGVASVDADFSGVPGRLNGTGHLRVADLHAGRAQLGPVDVAATARDGAWELEGDAFDGGVLVQATIAAKPDLPMSVRARWRDIDAARLLGSPPDLSAVLSGTLQASGPLRRPEEIAGEVEIAQLRLAHAGESLESESPLVLRLARGAVDIEPFALAGEATQVRGHGHVGRDGAVDIALTGGGSLGWLEAFVGPPLQSADGEVRFDVALRRPAGGALAASGQLRLTEGALDFGDAAALTGIEGVCSFADGAVKVESLQAGLGGGHVFVRGSVDLSAGPDLEWRLADVAIEPLRSLEVELRGAGRLRGPWDAVVLGGEVNVLQLLYDRDLEFTDLIPSFNRALRPPPKDDAGLPPLRLDLRIRAADSLYVENNIARLEGAADLRITGKTRAPKLRGEVSIVDGHIRLRGRQFDVVNGSLSFRPALGNVAAIDFKAESIIDTQDESYGVSVRVSGFTNDYRVSLASTDGALTPTDVASLITFGKTVSQLQSSGESGGGGGVSLDTLVNLAGNNLAGHLAERAEDVLPFDQIEFRTQFSTTTGQFEPEIRVGKSLSEDLSAWVGQTFGVQSRTSVEAEYRLSPSVSSALLWESSTASEQGALGGEIRFRRDFWRLGSLLFFGGE